MNKVTKYYTTEL